MPLTSLEGGGWWETEKKPCFGILRRLRLRRASNPSQSRSKQEQLHTFIMPLKICFDSKVTSTCIIKLEYSGVDGLFDASVYLSGRWGRLGGLAGRFIYPDKLAGLKVPISFLEKNLHTTDFHLARCGT